jgi:hypothetical protein
MDAAYLVPVLATLGSPLWSPRTPPRWLTMVIHVLCGLSLPLVLAYNLLLCLGPWALLVWHVWTYWADYSWLLLGLQAIGSCIMWSIAVCVYSWHYGVGTVSTPPHLRLCQSIT